GQQQRRVDGEVEPRLTVRLALRRDPRAAREPGTGGGSGAVRGYSGAVRVRAAREGDTGGARAAGVEHAQDAAVALRAPLLADQVRAPGAGAPVDAAGVVAGHVLAQGVELAALAAAARHHHAVDHAQPG